MVESRKVKSMLPMCSQWHAGSLHEPQKQHHTEVEQEAAVQSGLTARVLAQPFILQSQLYSSVKDRTQVDRDLESFKKDKVLRIFKLSSGQDDHAIMFMDDYLKQVSFAIKRSGGKDQDGSEVFEWFERYVVPSKLDVSITQLELCSLLSQGGDVTDKHITLLMNAGLLTRQLIDPNIYWFSIPRIGPILKGLSQGRKEILSLLNRRKYKEMPLSSLENTKTFWTTTTCQPWPPVPFSTS